MLINSNKAKLNVTSISISKRLLLVRDRVVHTLRSFSETVVVDVCCCLDLFWFGPVLVVAGLSAGFRLSFER